VQPPDPEALAQFLDLGTLGVQQRDHVHLSALIIRP
jgi:hypothetical protein